VNSPGDESPGYEQRPLKGASSRIYLAPFLALAFMPGRKAAATMDGPAENVGVNQESHRVSVDSDSMGTKYPFSGQARSQSKRP
jgi:hypothetical protein